MSERVRVIVLAMTYVGLLAIGIGGPLTQLAGAPAYTSGDEAAHMDYALQIWQGSLPVFEDGLVLNNTVGIRPPVQWTSHHPPLLYLLLAPMIGPIVESGDLIAAAIAGRLVVVAQSVALLFAVRWTTLQIFKDRRDIATLAAVITGLSVWFTRLGGSVYNDILAALVITMALGFLARSFRDGASRWNMTGLGVSLMAAALTRFSALPICFLLLCALLTHRVVIGRMKLLPAMVAPLLIGIGILASSGWFYVRNYRLTGNFSGGNPDWTLENSHRQLRPWTEVATDLEFWKRMLQQFGLPETAPSIAQWPSTLAGSFVLFLGPAILGLILLTVHLVRRKRAGDRIQVEVFMVVLSLTACALVAAMQISHTAGAGSSLPRYFFAMVPWLAPLMAWGLSARFLGPVLVTAWVAFQVVQSWYQLLEVNGNVRPGAQAPRYLEWTYAGFATLAVGATVATIAILWERRQHHHSRVQTPASARRH